MAYNEEYIYGGIGMIRGLEMSILKAVLLILFWIVMAALSPILVPLDAIKSIRQAVRGKSFYGPFKKQYWEEVWRELIITPIRDLRDI